MAKDNNYTSEAMNFIKELVALKPEIKDKQANLRNTWWDLDEQSVMLDSQLDKNNLKNDAYVYFTYHNNKK